MVDDLALEIRGLKTTLFPWLQFSFHISGVPMEVMGLMLGEFVDEYTVRVIDVFAMPQSGTGVSVEAVDPVFQVTTRWPMEMILMGFKKNPRA